MTAENFPRSLAMVLQSEGGNDDDPQDPGGRTSRGVEQKEYDAYCSTHGLPGGDVWSAPQEIIDDIYHTSYWEPWCDKLPPGIDYLYFDTAVNEGAHRATIQLQQSLGVDVDGHIGVITLNAAARMPPHDVINCMSDERVQFYHDLGRPRFLKGWLNRVASVRAEAIAMSTEYI